LLTLTLFVELVPMQNILLTLDITLHSSNH